MVPHADVRVKKRLLRTLIHEVIVDVDAEVGEVILLIHWQGGVHTELRVPRRRRGQNGAQTPKDLIEAVRVLARICSDDRAGEHAQPQRPADRPRESLDTGTRDGASDVP